MEHASFAWSCDVNGSAQEKREILQPARAIVTSRADEWALIAGWKACPAVDLGRGSGQCAARRDDPGGRHEERDEVGERDERCGANGNAIQPSTRKVPWRGMSVPAAPILMTPSPL